MTVQNQAFDASEAVATEEAKPVDPTLASIRQEREEAAAERARLQAEREERQRVATKRELIGEVLNMQADIEKRYQEVKAQKKLLKGLRNDLKALDAEDELTADDLKDLLTRGHEAYWGEQRLVSVYPEVMSRASISAIVHGALGGCGRVNPAGTGGAASPAR